MVYGGGGGSGVPGKLFFMFVRFIWYMGERREAHKDFLESVFYMFFMFFRYMGEGGASEDFLERSFSMFFKYMGRGVRLLRTS